MKYEYFTKYITIQRLDRELFAFGEEGWKLVYIGRHEQSPDWFAIFIREVR